MKKTSFQLSTILQLLIFVVTFTLSTSCNSDDGPVIDVVSIVVEGDDITDGTISQMTATVYPENATNRDIIWSVSDSAIASIDQEGLLTAKGNGKIRVYATATDGTEIRGSKLIEISGYTIPVESIEIIGETSITNGSPFKFSVNITPSAASNQSVIWSVSDEGIATIDTSGYLRPKANGMVTVKAALESNESMFAEVNVTISGYSEPEVVDAFPGAEGFARTITGGRGGRVIYVTNLKDGGEGSLRAAIDESGKRYIVFAVSGTIKLNSSLKIRNGDVTIAGQTAPGDGITLRDYPVTIDADNVVIRYMRFRMGDEAGQEGDALGGRFRKDLMIDHCSMSWSTDECVSFYVNENTTVQWCLIAESLNSSVHVKGAHGYGGIWGGKKASFHHNLLANHNSRNPRLGESAGTDYALTDLVDLRNNVIYNWGSNSCYGAEGMNVNIVNCYYKYGPATSSSKRGRIISIDHRKDEGDPLYQVWGKFFIDGNYLDGSTQATNDNWTYGVYNQFHSSYGTVSQEDKDAMKIDAPHNIENNVYTHTAQEAYEKVVDYVGASLVRDAVDIRILDQVENRTYTSAGSNGSTNGIIDTPSDVGGWPTLNSETPPTDTSGDGMPDEWKIAKGLDPDLYEPNGHDLHSGYENIEVYLNELVEDITNGQK